jgi:hypothetical protein
MSVSYFMLFISLISQNFPIKYQYNSAEGTGVSNVVSITAEILLPPLNKSMYSHPVTAVLSPLEPLMHDILQCLVNGIMVSSQVIFVKGPTR